MKLTFFSIGISGSLLFTVQAFELSDLSLNCSSLWANGFPDPTVRNTDLRCTRYLDKRNIRLANLKLYVPEQYFVSREVQEATYESAKRSLLFLDTSLGQGFKPITVSKFAISIIFSQTAHSQDMKSSRPNDETTAFTFTEFFDLDHESCPIVIYPNARKLTGTQLSEMVAHEVFHCIQKFQFPSQTRYAIEHTQELWWYEGLAQSFAESFSQLSLNSNLSDLQQINRAALFGEYDLARPFFDQANPYLSASAFTTIWANDATDREATAATHSRLRMRPTNLKRPLAHFNPELFHLQAQMPTTSLARNKDSRSVSLFLTRFPKMSSLLAQIQLKLDNAGLRQ